MTDIRPFHVMELMAKARELESNGRSIVHLEIGEPDFQTAQPIVAAAQQFLSHGHVHYTASLGLPELRNAIAHFYQTRYQLNVDPKRVVITAGASGALLLALGVLVNAGDEWLIPDPGYPCNRNFARVFDGKPIPIPVSARSNFQPTPEDISRHWTANTRGLMVASPANPTGTILTQPQITNLWREVSARNGHLIVDEIYHGLTYGLELQSALAVDSNIFVINSFSKYFGMTGWRLGWMVVPEHYLRDVEKLAQNLFICPSTIAQHAALAAFKIETLEILEARRTTFTERRTHLLDGLRSLGFEISAEPQGAFYIYADCKKVCDDSYVFADDLLTKAGVAITSGKDFGTNLASSHVRFAYTSNISQLDEALRRIRNYLA
jgi:aspartate/methionine/tyrosine aminotransferase